MNAGIIAAPSSQAVHRLGTALRGALLVFIGVRTSVAIKHVLCTDGIESAAPVLVITTVMVTVTIGTPVSNTVHRLAALFHITLNSTILMWTLFTIQITFNRNNEGPAALVLVAISNMIAASISFPCTNTVHRLTATALCALNKGIIVRASIAIIQGNLANTVHTAALVLVIFLFVVASVIHAPSTNTVHRLGTLLSGALLKLVGIWASISVVRRSN